MAVYKVIQDIESEDKLLGPLTFKGLVYAGIVVMCGFINFKLLTTSSGGPLRFVFIFILLMPMILFGVLASPLGREQPTEVWLLSRIRFMLKSRRRIWDQSGMTHLVTITVPKKIEAILTKNFTQDEVKSRLSALANTLDSRGWVIKNVNVNIAPVTPSYFQQEGEEDRLVDTSTFVQEVPEVSISAADDILDEQNNPTAQNVQSLMVQAEQSRRDQLQQKVEAARTEYLGVEPQKDTSNLTIHDLKPQPLVGFGHNSRPAGAGVTAPAQEVNQMTHGGRAAKLELAQSGNDLSVASIARLANRNDSPGGEVAIALH
jgi:hypothetical protein